MRTFQKIILGAAAVALLALCVTVSTYSGPAGAKPQPDIDAYGNVRVVAPLVHVAGGIGIASGSGSVAGVVTTGTQTFAGAKTFSGAVTLGSTVAATGAATLNGGASIGTSGTPITASFRCTGTLGTTAIAANTTATQDITCTGAAVAADCVVGGPATLEAGLIQTCIVPSADTVRVRTHNGTAGSITPAGSQTVAVRVFNP